MSHAGLELRVTSAWITSNRLTRSGLALDRRPADGLPRHDGGYGRQRGGDAVRDLGQERRRAGDD